jgi:uncharacterized protein DUF6228
VSAAVLHSAPSSPHVGRIEFGQTRRGSGGWAGTATVAYDGEEWGVELDMIDVYTSDMVGFFEEIARERRGWSGVKRWRSEFEELTLEATNPGHAVIELTFSLWWSRGDALDNERQGEVHIRADEVPAFVGQIRELTGLQARRNCFRQGR